MNMLFPAAVEATQLFCQDIPFEHSTKMHPSPSCWMETGSDTIQSDLNQYGCSFDQVCEQTIESGLSETLVVHHQNIQVLGVPLTGSAVYSTLNKHSKTVSDISPETVIPIREIYLINSTLLN
jgi:hypothetical protein